MVPGVRAAIERRWRIVAIRIRFLPVAGTLGIGAMTDGAILLKQPGAIIDHGLVEPAFGCAAYSG